MFRALHDSSSGRAISSDSSLAHSVRARTHRQSQFGARESGVVTLTPSPVIDRSYRVATLSVGTVNRGKLLGETFSGKGINLSLNLQTAGFLSGAVFPSSASDQPLIVRNFQEKPSLPNIAHAAVPVAHPTRLNCVLIEESGQTTNINQIAPELSDHEWHSLINHTLHTLQTTEASWLVIAGSLPVNSDTGKPLNLSTLITEAKKLNIRICLDTSGPTLREWIFSSDIDLVAPNLSELYEALEIPQNVSLHTSELIESALSRGVNNLLLTLGPQGVVFANTQTRLWASARAKKLLNTTGAGDAALAGFLSQLPLDVELKNLDNYALSDAVLTAASWGAHTVAFETPRAPNFVDAPAARLLTQLNHHLTTSPKIRNVNDS